jgi:hypothetical protein
MSMVLDLYIDVDRKERVRSPADSSVVAMPSFAQGNITTFRVRALQPSAVFNAPYTVVPNAGKTIQLAIGTKVGGTTTHCVEQFAWSLNADMADPYFYADVNFNTDQVSSLLGSNPAITSFLEINLVDGGQPRTIFSKQVTIEASVIKNAVLTVMPGQTALSLEAAVALFLQRTITGPITLVCATDPTKRRDLFIDTDGSWHDDAS